MTIRYIIAALVGYLLGSVSISLILSTVVMHNDVRKHGSGNAGATNVARVFGLSAGVLTLVGDMLKTAAAGLIGQLLAHRLGLAIGCFACLLGHCWPIYFKFQGGKGVSVGACISLLLDWRLFLILFVIFAVMFLISRRISACSVTAAAAFPVAYFVLNPGFRVELFLCILLGILVIFQHRSNIHRLLRGEEPKFQFKK